MKLVVGLGNPGPEYQKTRHNVGFEVIEELRRRHANTSPQRRFDGETVDIFLGNEKILLLAPLTYMNLSGRSVGAATEFYKLSPGQVLVVCDDLNLEPGRLRLRTGGSTTSFWRTSPSRPTRCTMRVASTSFRFSARCNRSCRPRIR